MTTLVLAEDHRLVREGLRCLLQQDPTLRVLGEAEDGLQAVEMVEKLEPNVLLLDLGLPRLHGLELIQRLRRRSATRIVVLSMYGDDAYVIEALKGGAWGYVVKDAPTYELIEGIRAAVEGRRYLSSALRRPPLEDYLRTGRRSESDGYGQLTKRERLVFQLAAEGNTSDQIASRLYISRRTVETHRANLMRKLVLRGQTDLVRYAIRKGLVSV